MRKLIRMAAALIDDGNGSLFLVRKKGTAAFMQAGGKIEEGEEPYEALIRELAEELTLTPMSKPQYIGLRTAKAANEPGRSVEAHLFHLRTSTRPFIIGGELEEGLWVSLAGAARLNLAPLTRHHVLPLAHSLYP